MRSDRSKRVMTWLVTAIAIIVVDQATKYVASQHIVYGERLNILPFFNLTLVHNTGAAFSLLANASGWQRWFFVMLGTVVSVVLITWMSKLSGNEKLTGWSLTLVLGGAIGNVIDRLIYGYVIDFLDVFVGEYHWPAFNIADSAICIGAVMLVVLSLFNIESQQDSESSST